MIAALDAAAHPMRMCSFLAGQNMQAHCVRHIFNALGLQVLLSPTFLDCQGVFLKGPPLRTQLSFCLAN